MITSVSFGRLIVDPADSHKSPVRLSLRLRLDKEQWLDRYRTGDFSMTALTWHDIDVREYGDSVVTIGSQLQRSPSTRFASSSPTEPSPWSPGPSPRSSASSARHSPTRHVGTPRGGRTKKRARMSTLGRGSTRGDARPMSILTPERLTSSAEPDAISPRRCRSGRR
jgi:hypothetical protein